MSASITMALVTTKCKLLIDSRESLVTRHDVEWKAIRYEIINNMTTGDYNIVDPQNRILATIERKSLKDFADSIGDGRTKNIDKLKKIRETHGCRIIYIVEGPQSPEPSKEFARKPYSTIESAIFHLILRDQIAIINTSDTVDTAKKLARFVKSCDTLLENYIVPSHVETPMELIVGAAERTDAEVRAELTEVHIRSDADILRDLWSSWRGISIGYADEFSKRWSIADIVSGRIDRAQINAVKSVRGRAIPTKVANALCGMDRQLEMRILKQIPGVSIATATCLVLDRSLKDLLLMNAATIAEIKIGKKQRAFGQSRADTLLRFLNLKIA